MRKKKSFIQQTRILTNGNLGNSKSESIFYWARNSPIFTDKYFKDNKLNLRKIYHENKVIIFLKNAMTTPIRHKSTTKDVNTVSTKWYRVLQNITPYCF